MKSIKFRGYYKPQDKVYTNVQCAYDYVNFGDNDDAIPATNFGDMLNDDDWIIQQFTGMYADAEQTKEIYEGDFIDNTFSYKGKTITVRYLVTQSKFTGGYWLVNQNKQPLGSIKGGADITIAGVVRLQGSVDLIPCCLTSSPPLSQ